MLNRRGFLKGIFGAVALIAAAPALRVTGEVFPIPPPPKPKVPDLDRRIARFTRYQPIIRVKALGLLPAGTITYHPVDKPVPDGWLLCDGREVPKGMYMELEAALKSGAVNYPYGDSAWHYNVPDFRGRA